MKSIRASSLLSFAILAAPVAALADERPTVPAGRWNVDWGEQYCSLIRRSDQPPMPLIALRTTPGTGLWDIRLISESWPAGALDQPALLHVALEPGGQRIVGTAVVEQTRAGTALAIGQLPPDILRLFAAARSVRVERQGQLVLEVPTPSAAAAVDAVRECEEEVMRSWGIDPEAQSALRSPPRGSLAAAMRVDDYPTSAIERREQGTVVVLLRIDERGRAVGCLPISSSGSEVLDRTTCDIFRRRLRMEPAIGADGVPTAAHLVGRVTWLIPAIARP